MLKKIAILLLISFSPIALANSTTLIQEAEEAVRYDLLDPFSAKMRNIRIVTNSYGVKSVCGAVNAKNRFGAYSGFTLFVYFNGKAYLEPNDYDPERIFETAAISSGCAGTERELEARKLKEQAEEKTRILAQAKIDKENAKAMQKLLAEQAKEEKRMQAAREIEDKKNIALKAKEDQIAFEQNKKLIKEYCGLAYNYYIDRISKGAPHGEAFTPIQILFSNNDIKPLVGELSEVEKILMQSEEEYHSNENMNSGFHKNGFVFKAMVKNDCYLKYLNNNQ
ncbi:hypothetical protein [Acinetobacter pittii]|uniref:hypothetical protein n=1 Tax=Acinetobacter pittii TaxID=48296 RepID=UPI0024DED058|nr:hypothetical protein [Acinetobacter pittii]